MKIKHQLSIATLLMAGVFVTGCSQQSAGGSQVAGGSQTQNEGASQVAGGSQAQTEGGSQQQVEGAAPVVAEPVMAPAPVVVAPAPVMAPKPVNRWAHNHPEAPACAKTRSHTHKYSVRTHRHNYACQQMAAPAKPQVDVRALQMKLKAKGYYKGPIDGIVGPGTRSALQRFMQR